MSIVEEKFNELLDAIHIEKPGPEDNQEYAREYAIVRTEVQKAHAYYMWYIATTKASESA